MVTFKQHRERWKSCTECTLCERRKKVVLARGTVPCDVLFIEEAPGQSEDVLGVPFVGPAGQLLDGIIEQSDLPQSGLTWAFTNLVACIPKDETNTKTAEPAKEHMDACFKRLKEFVRLCKPRVIINVGKLSKQYIYGEAMFSKSGGDKVEWLREDQFIRFGEITHPAAILRADITQRGLMAQRAEAIISEVVYAILNEV